MSDLTESKVSEVFDQLILDERHELIMQAADAQGVIVSRAFKLNWLDDATGVLYALRGFRVPNIGVLTFSLLRRDSELENSELRFNENTPTIQTSGPICRETRHLTPEQEQVYLGSLVCRVLGNMIAEGRSEQL
jgi:hypothetical protein